ncbi:type II secretion system protein GspL [Shimia sagamensis]|uniref:Type II secretion system protein L n=1 Tax=Shimia sagamensis TaxID=1566352 RepID=A0ABY1NCQ1_9RHOB|nr:type II secretion system protein GspL [Shimia sagamensis]SMP05759.1 type II secretion system protein L [Shimia sagamensis]
MLQVAKTANPAKTGESSAVFARAGDGTQTARHIVLAPGHAVPLIQLDLPKSLRGQAREQVAQRQLTDRMGLNDTVQMRPCVLGTKGEDWSRVFVADHAQMAEWRGYDCRAVLPDYLSLPTSEGLWTFSQVKVGETTIVMMRFGPSDGASTSIEMAEAVVSQALNNGSKPKAVLWQGESLTNIDALMSARDVPVVTDPDLLKELDVDHPSVLTHGELACDLRTDPMAARTRLAQQVLPWRWTVLAAALGVTLWIVSQLVAIGRIEDQTAKISVQTQEIVKEHFVPTGPILDVRSQVSRVLLDLRQSHAGGGATLDVLDLTAEVGAVLDAADSVPEMVSYTRDNGLLIVVRMPDFGSAERLTAALQTDHMSAELEESRVSDGQVGVRTEIRISPKEPNQ